MPSPSAPPPPALGPAPRILGIGDNVVDCYRDSGLMYPGGNSLNHAVFARRFGAVTAYAGAVADDAAGRAIHAALAAEGVETGLLRFLPGQTAFCVIANEEGERHFIGANLGVSIIAPSPADLTWMEGADAVHTGRSSFLDAWLGEIAARARLSYDLATIRDPLVMKNILPHCYLASFSGGDLTRDGALALALQARDMGGEWVLVTRGAEGALLAGPDGVTEAAAPSLSVRDTLGAGDICAARVLVGLLSGEAPTEALPAATAAASETCLAAGAFGHAAPMAVPLHSMQDIATIYRDTRPAPGPATGSRA